MTASVTSPEDLINVALVRIGYKERVTNIYEGSRASDAALAVYAQTRDQILRAGDWGFAETNLVMTLLKQAPAGGYVPPTVWSPAYPALPWTFSFAYPSDCLKVRAVKPVPLFVPNFSPQPYLFSVDNDNSLSPPAKVVLTNCNPAILVYTGQIIDPTQWEADFVEAFAAALARRLAPMLSTLEAEKMEIPDEASADMVAERKIG